MIIHPGPSFYHNRGYINIAKRQWTYQITSGVDILSPVQFVYKYDDLPAVALLRSCKRINTEAEYIGYACNKFMARHSPQARIDDPYQRRKARSTYVIHQSLKRYQNIGRWIKKIIPGWLSGRFLPGQMYSSMSVLHWTDWNELQHNEPSYTDVLYLAAFLRITGLSNTEKLPRFSWQLAVIQKLLIPWRYLLKSSSNTCSAWIGLLSTWLLDFNRCVDLRRVPWTPWLTGTRADLPSTNIVGEMRRPFVLTAIPAGLCIRQRIWWSCSTCLEAWSRSVHCLKGLELVDPSTKIKAIREAILDKKQSSVHLHLDLKWSITRLEATESGRLYLTCVESCLTMLHIWRDRVLFGMKRYQAARPGTL